jgi:hypothetical protein
VDTGFRKRSCANKQHSRALCIFGPRRFAPRDIVPAARISRPGFWWRAVARRSPDERNPGNEPQSLSRISFHSSGLRSEKKGSGTPADAMSHARTQAACGTRHGESGLRRPPLAGALACRRSTTVLAKGTFVPRAQRRARLPEGGAKAAACRTRRQRSQRSTSRAGLSAGRHDARAARVRTVSFRPRAPHSLRRQGVPSPDGSFAERDS